MIERKSIGEPEHYKGKKIVVNFMGPDVLCSVNNTELPNFYINPEAARAAGKRYVDLLEKHKKKAS